MKLSTIFAIVLWLTLNSVRSEESNPKWLSPDKKYSIITTKSAERTRYNGGLLGVQLLDDHNQVLATYDPEARSLDVLWSPQSSFVAINEDISHASGNLSVWKLFEKGWKQVKLPTSTQDIFQLLQESEKQSFVHWWGAHSATPKKWLSDDELQIEISGEAELKENRNLSVHFEGTLKCLSDCTAKVLEQKQLKYEVRSLERQTKSGLKGWTVATARNDRNAWINRRLIVVDQNNKEHEFDAEFAFIWDWGFTDEDKNIVICSINAHGPFHWEKFEISTGKRIDYYFRYMDPNNIPEWVKPFMRDQY